MEIRKIIGVVLICISIVLSIIGIVSMKMTGSVIGLHIKTSLLSLLNILTLVFFLVGLLLISKVGKSLATLLVAGATIVGGNKAYAPAKGSIIEHRPAIETESVEINAPYWTELGRFQRTYRWDETLDIMEDKYNLPKGILKGLAMHESYGDPVRLNEGEDGGAGLFMFQPRTAKAYGLKIFGKSNSSSADKKHGGELKKLVKKYHNDYKKLAEFDERFDVAKSADAAARYLKDEFEKYHSWSKVLSAYNQGEPAPYASYTNYVKEVKKYQDYYNQKDKVDHKFYVQKPETKGHIASPKKGKGRR